MKNEKGQGATEYILLLVVIVAVVLLFKKSCVESPRKELLIADPKESAVSTEKVCGWKDLKTMQHYVRLAGIEVDGATESLKLLTPRETMENVVNLFRE